MPGPLRIRTTSLSIMSNDASSSQILSPFGNMFEQGVNSDLTILNGARSYLVHRALLSSRSEFFKGACSNPWLESQTGIIDLSEDDEESIGHMINYFYHFDYLMRPNRPLSRRPSRTSSTASSQPASPSVRRPRKLNLALIQDPLLAQMASTPETEEQEEPELSTPTVSTKAPLTPPAEESIKCEFDFKSTPPDSAVEMVDDFDPFQVQEMEIPAQEANDAEAQLLTHAKVYCIADKYGIEGLKTLARAKFACQIGVHWKSPELPTALLEVYETTVDSDRGLRNLCIQAFRTHPELAKRKDVEQVVKETPGLAWDLFRMAMGMPI